MPDRSLRNTHSVSTFGVYAVYLLAGIVAGVVSGLFGLGGGLTIVPALALALPLQGVGQQHAMHLAIGTSLAVMCVTALYTTVLRDRHGDMNWPLFWRMLVPVLVGTGIGAVVSKYLPGGVLRILFIAFVAYMLARTLYRQRRQSEDPDTVAGGGVGVGVGVGQTVFPSLASRWASGLTTGVSGALLGAGAAIITVPFLRGAGYRMPEASAIAAGLSAAIGLGAGAGYLLGGLNEAGLPPHAIGYLYLPAFAGMAVGALVGSPAGIRISHRMDESTQFRLFVGYLAVVLVSMLLNR